MQLHKVLISTPSQTPRTNL